MRTRILLLVACLVCAAAPAFPKAQVLDGGPVSLNKAQTWCIAPAGPLPNWDSPAHPECKMVWRVLAQSGDRTLYSARYAWPSTRRGDQPLRVLTEVLYQGVRGSRILRRLYAVQDDEAHVRLAAVRILAIGGTQLIESRVCLTGTEECGRELAVWTGDGIAAIDDRTVAEIRAQLPKGYDLKSNPELDLASMSGSGKAWARDDADCCPSAVIAFTLRLDGGELHVADVKLKRSGA